VHEYYTVTVNDAHVSPVAVQLLIVSQRDRPNFGFGFGYGAETGNIFSFDYGRNREGRFRPKLHQGFGVKRNCPCYPFARSTVSVLLCLHVDSWIQPKTTHSLTHPSLWDALDSLHSSQSSVTAENNTDSLAHGQQLTSYLEQPRLHRSTNIYATFAYDWMLAELYVHVSSVVAPVLRLLMCWIKFNAGL